jgi:hypothetical protein
MKYLWGIGLGKDPGFSTSAGTVTLSDSGSHANVESKNIELIVNITRNIVLFNKNNPDLTATFTGGGTADVVATIPGGVAGATSDLIHAWVDLPDGRSGIDFLSELAVKDRTYAALKNVDITLEAETLNIDFAPTNERIDLTNQALGSSGSTEGATSMMGQIMEISRYTKQLYSVNPLNIGQGHNSDVDEDSVIGKLMRLDLHQGSTASPSSEISVIGLQKKNKELMLALLAIPEYPVLENTGITGDNFGVAGFDLTSGGFGQDLSKGETMVSIRALTAGTGFDVLISLGSHELFTSLGGTGAAMNMGGFTGDIVNEYPLGKDDYIQANAKLVKVVQQGGATGAQIQVTLVNTYID